MLLRILSCMHWLSPLQLSMVFQFQFWFLFSRCWTCGSWTRSLSATRPRDQGMLASSGAQLAMGFLKTLLPSHQDTCYWNVWQLKVLEVSFTLLPLLYCLLRYTNARRYQNFHGRVCGCGEKWKINSLFVCQWTWFQKVQNSSQGPFEEGGLPLQTCGYVAWYLGRGDRKLRSRAQHFMNRCQIF